MLVLILAARIRLARAQADPVVNAPEWVPGGDLTSYTIANAGTFATWGGHIHRMHLDSSRLAASPVAHCEVRRDQTQADHHR
jgi:hypothetical protein